MGEVLRQAGFETWIAGGAVRDILLGRIPHDFDLATAANPDQVEKLFPVTVSVGKQFGVIVVVEGDLQLEVATFRGESGYYDGRRPTEIKFVTAEIDAIRRDFTINAMFLDWRSNAIIDYVGGRQDLKDKLIRTVGTATTRFLEDHLRLLRALRFKAQLGFSIEAKTWQAIQANIELLDKISRERIRQELGKLLTADHVAEIWDDWSALRLERHLFASISEFQISVEKVKAVQKIQLTEWSRFFLAAQLSGQSEQAIRSAVRSLKGSASWEQGVFKNLYWFFQPEDFAKKSLGEVIAMCFDAELFVGLREWINYSHNQGTADSETLKKWNLLLARQPKLAPKPLLTAQDFQDRFSGPPLGGAIRTAYWIQLEAGELSKEELMQRTLLHLEARD